MLHWHLSNVVLDFVGDDDRDDDADIVGTDILHWSSMAGVSGIGPFHSLVSDIALCGSLPLGWGKKISGGGNNRSIENDQNNRMVGFFFSKN